MIELRSIPCEVAQLTFPGRMLLWSLRHWAAAARCDREVPACVWMTLQKVWGLYEVVSAVRRLWCALDANARQPIIVRTPDHPLLSRDEQLILAAVCASTWRVPDVVPWLLADILAARSRPHVVARVAQLGDLARIRGIELGCATPAVLAVIDRQ